MGSPQTAALAWNLLLKDLFMGFSLLQATSTCSTVGSSTWHCQISVSQYIRNRALPQNLLTSLNMQRLLHVFARSYSFTLEASCGSAKQILLHKEDNEETEKISYLWISFCWNSLTQYKAISGYRKLPLISKIGFITMSTKDTHIQLLLLLLFMN